MVKTQAHDIKFEVFFYLAFVNLYGFQFSQEACTFLHPFLSSFMVCKLIRISVFTRSLHFLNPLPEGEELVDLSSDRQKFEGP